MAANEAVDALQDELVALTCEEQKPSLFKKLPRCVLIALAQRYLTATQRAALAASERYAREELVTKGELVSSVWRVTWISQTAAVRMLSTVPPRQCPSNWSASRGSPPPECFRATPGQSTAPAFGPYFRPFSFS